MGQLPTDRNTTYGDRTVIKSDDLNDLQDCVKFGAHGEIEVPLDLSNRIVSGGAWTSGSGGTLTESGSGNSCRVGITIPVGSTITRIRVRGQQTGATDQFTAELQGATGIGAGASPIGALGTSSSAITGTEQDVPVTENTTTGPNTRYFIRIGTTGGGTGNRVITGAYVTFVKTI